MNCNLTEEEKKRFSDDKGMRNALNTLHQQQQQSTIPGIIFTDTSAEGFSHRAYTKTKQNAKDTGGG